MIFVIQCLYFSLERRRGGGFDGFGTFYVVNFDTIDSNREHTAAVVVLERVTFELTTRDTRDDFTPAALSDESRRVALGVGAVTFEVSGEAVNVLAAVQRGDVKVAGVVTGVEETVVIVLVTDEGEGFGSPGIALDGTVDVHFVAVFDARVVERQPDADAVHQARSALFDGTTSITGGVLGEGVLQGNVVVLCRVGEEFGGLFDESSGSVEAEGGVSKLGLSRAEVPLRGCKCEPEESGGKQKLHHSIK